MPMRARSCPHRDIVEGCARVGSMDPDPAELLSQEGVDAAEAGDDPDNLVRIGELSRRTGVSDHTLRAWENRYGLLRPHRTVGGFRLYSASDERRIQWMNALLSSGLSPAEAAKVVLHHRDDETMVLRLPQPSSTARTERPVTEGRQRAGQLPPSGLTGMWGRTLTSDVEAESHAGGANGAGDTLTALQSDLVRALAGFDELAAHDVLDHALSHFSLAATLRSVVVPTVEYFRGLSVMNPGTSAASAASAVSAGYAAHVLRGRLGGLTRGSSIGVGPTAVVGALDGRWSELMTLCAGLVLHRAGWRVIFISEDAATTIGAAERLAPGLVYLRADQPGAFTARAKDLEHLAASATVVVTGAAATPELARSTGAVFAGGELVSEAARIARVAGLGRSASIRS